MLLDSHADSTIVFELEVPGNLTWYSFDFTTIGHNKMSTYPTTCHQMTPVLCKICVHVFDTGELDEVKQFDKIVIHLSKKKVAQPQRPEYYDNKKMHYKNYLHYLL